MSSIAVILLLLQVLTPGHPARPPQVVMDTRDCLHPAMLQLT